MVEIASRVWASFQLSRSLMSLGLRLLTVDCDGVENDDKDDCGIRIPFDDDDDDTFGGRLLNDDDAM